MRPRAYKTTMWTAGLVSQEQIQPTLHSLSRISILSEPLLWLVAHYIHTNKCLKMQYVT